MARTGPGSSIRLRSYTNRYRDLWQPRERASRPTSHQKIFITVNSLELALGLSTKSMSTRCNHFRATPGYGAVI